MSERIDVDDLQRVADDWQVEWVTVHDALQRALVRFSILMSDHAQLQERIRGLEHISERTVFDVIWGLLQPYIASEDVVYGEEEMQQLCEGVLPKVWDAILTMRASHQPLPIDGQLALGWQDDLLAGHGD